MQKKRIYHGYLVQIEKSVPRDHQNLINSLNQPNVTIYEVWPESVIWFKRQSLEAFLVKICKFQSAGVTLKMRS